MDRGSLKPTRMLKCLSSQYKALGTKEDFKYMVYSMFSKLTYVLQKWHWFSM